MRFNSKLKCSVFKFSAFRHLLLVLLLVCISSTVMAPASAAVDKTSVFIGYLGDIHRTVHLDRPDFQKFIDRLEAGELVNPVPVEFPDTRLPFDRLEAQFAHRGIDTYIQQVQSAEIYINFAEVLAWAKLQLIDEKRKDGEREEVQGETEFVEKKISFQRVKGRKFYMDLELFKKPIHIPVSVLDFEMQSTQVKEWHWVMIMGNNPSAMVENQSRKKILPYIIDLETPFEKWTVKEDPVFYQLDRYVSGIGPDEIRAFLDRLNLLSVLNSPILIELMEDFKAGDQFRIPTEAEWSSVVQNHHDRRERFKCENANAYFTTWIVDGNSFDGFSDDVFEWVDDGWNSTDGSWPRSVTFKQGRVPAIDASVSPRVGAREALGPNFQVVSSNNIFLARRTWSGANIPGIYGNCRQYGKVYAGQKTIRLVRMRKKTESTE